MKERSTWYSPRLECDMTLVRCAIVTPVYLVAREALGHSYLLRVTAFILLMAMLLYVRKKNKLASQKV